MDMLLSDLPRTRAEAILIGLKYYFTNKACKNGHIDKRFVSTGTCCVCQAEFVKNYRESNRDAIREQKKNYDKNYRESNRDAIRESDKNYNLRKRASRLGCSVEDLPKRAPQLEPSRYVYFLVVKDSEIDEKLFLKVGITNNPTTRLKTHKRQLSKHRLIFDTILIKDFETEEAARAVEDKIKSSYMVYESGIKGFTDECFMYLPQFEESMFTLLSTH